MLKLPFIKTSVLAFLMSALSLAYISSGHTRAQTQQATDIIPSVKVDHVWSPTMQQQKAMLEEITPGTGVKLSQTPDRRLKIVIPSSVSFDRYFFALQCCAMMEGSESAKIQWATGPGLAHAYVEPVLKKLAFSLQQNPRAHATIVGYTAALGGQDQAKTNQVLSLHRANAVHNYLVGLGVADSRLSVEGHGSKLVLASTTPPDLDQYCRIEIYITE